MPAAPAAAATTAVAASPLSLPPPLPLPTPPPLPPQTPRSVRFSHRSRISSPTQHHLTHHSFATTTVKLAVTLGCSFTVTV